MTCSSACVAISQISFRYIRFQLSLFVYWVVHGRCETVLSIAPFCEQYQTRACHATLLQWLTYSACLRGAGVWRKNVFQCSPHNFPLQFNDSILPPCITRRLSVTPGPTHRPLIPVLLRAHFRQQPAVRSVQGGAEGSVHTFCRWSPAAPGPK